MTTYKVLESSGDSIAANFPSTVTSHWVHTFSTYTTGSWLLRFSALHGVDCIVFCLSGLSIREEAVPQSCFEWGTVRGRMSSCRLQRHPHTAYSCCQILQTIRRQSVKDDDHFSIFVFDLRRIFDGNVMYGAPAPQLIKIHDCCPHVRDKSLCLCRIGTIKGNWSADIGVDQDSHLFCGAIDKLGVISRCFWLGKAPDCIHQYFLHYIDRHREYVYFGKDVQTRTLEWLYA